MTCSRSLSHTFLHSRFITMFIRFTPSKSQHHFLIFGSIFFFLSSTWTKIRKENFDNRSDGRRRIHPQHGGRGKQSAPHCERDHEDDHSPPQRVRQRHRQERAHSVQRVQDQQHVQDGLSEIKRIMIPPHGLRGEHRHKQEENACPSGARGRYHRTHPVRHDCPKDCSVAKGYQKHEPKTLKRLGHKEVFVLVVLFSCVL